MGITLILNPLLCSLILPLYLFLFSEAILCILFQFFSLRLQHPCAPYPPCCTYGLQKYCELELFPVCQECGTKKNLSPRRESNPWPPVHWSGALTTEPTGRLVASILVPRARRLFLNYVSCSSGNDQKLIFFDWPIQTVCAITLKCFGFYA